MHFVTGGAFNGKSRWVKEYYELNETPYLWISAYKGDPVPEHTDNWMDVMILEGLEKWVQEWSSQLDSHEIREKWRSLLCNWLKWEKEAGLRKLILIGTDLSKGIVPMRAEERKWRDITGWTYQDVAGMAEKIDLIWYGISQKIK